MSLFVKRYRTPGKQYYTLFDSMTKQPHLLIAGATGSGKSVVENGIIYRLLQKLPTDAQLILIDPKRVELAQWAKCPHVIRYASEPETMLSALRLALQITEERYQRMQKKRIREYNGGHVYVIIDELADLMTTQKKAVLPVLQRLGQIARAAHVHMIACTQTVKADVLPTVLTCNFDSRVALRTSTAQQSRMIIDVAGCECFPDPKAEKRALCYFRQGANLTVYQVPMHTEEELQDLADYWTSKRCRA